MITLIPKVDVWPYSEITMEEVGNALKKMGRAKTVRPNTIEVWKCLYEIRWLIGLFNV